MPNIPTVPGSEIDYNTPAKAVHLDAQALSGPRMRGAAAMAGALDQVANLSERVDDDILKAREVGIAADIDLKLRTARQTFLDSLHNDSNEQEWGQRAVETANTTREDVYAAHPDLPPRMRPHVEAAIKGWQGSLETETHALSDQQTITRAWGRVQQDYRESLVDDHADHAASLLEQARQKKLADPAIIDQMERDIPKVVASNYIHRGFDNNPQKTLELLQSGGSLPAVDQDGRPIVPAKVFLPKELETMTTEGRQRAAAWQKDNLQKLLATANPQGIVPEEDIRAKMASKEISETMGLNQIKAQNLIAKAQNEKDAKELRKSDEAKEATLSLKIHDPKAWGVNADLYAHSIIEQASDISDPKIKARVINDANHQLTSVKKSGETADSPYVREQMEFLKKDFETRTAVTPVIGVYVHGGPEKLAAMPQSELDELFGKGANREDLIKRSQAFVERFRGVYADQTKQLLTFAKANPDATPEELGAERQRIQRPQIEARVDEALRGKPSPSNPQDLAAWDWAMANSKDPRSQQIFERLSK